MSVSQTKAEVAVKAWKAFTRMRAESLLDSLIEQIRASDPGFIEKEIPTLEDARDFMDKLVKGAWAAGFQDALWSLENEVIVIAPVENN